MEVLIVGIIICIWLAFMNMSNISSLNLSIGSLQTALLNIDYTNPLHTEYSNQLEFLQNQRILNITSLVFVIIGIIIIGIMILKKRK